MAVSIGLCRLLNLDHALAATVACLLAAPPGGKTQILSLLRVGSDPDSHSVRESLRGVPGESVTFNDLKFLVSSCFIDLSYVFLASTFNFIFFLISSFFVREILRKYNI